MRHVRPLAAAALAVGLLVALGHGYAQEGSHAEVTPSRRVGEYAGVQGGSATPPPRARALGRARSTLITWPGFEPRQDGSSRFFLQLSAPVATETSSSEGRFEVLVRGASTHVRNTRRWLRTQHFNTPVTKARVERRGRRDLAFVFHLRANVTPSVTSQSASGEAGQSFHYVYVDFPAGNFRPEPTPAPTPVQGEQAEDDEVPPNIYD